MTSLSEIYMRHAKPIQEESTKRNKRNSAETSEAAPPSNKKTNSKLAKSSIAKKEQKGNVVTKKSPTEGIAESHQQTLVDAVSNRKYSLRAKNNVPPHRLLRENEPSKPELVVADAGEYMESCGVGPVEVENSDKGEVVAGNNVEEGIPEPEVEGEDEQRVEEEVEEAEVEEEAATVRTDESAEIALPRKTYELVI
ncbi:uncharacterized protein CELE_C42D4.19 [Caenorhabditis elegans]|uniref:Uncharacterized protein n=1 Tax=Caenorhabditis elegans TaxID=6239 RepID=U4PAW9_CAEEL|nr:Uncharacterized protein CELE_C42D4.19 [Caenorhabditis elegans]CDH93026.1 Uncharacterized protein CELE_C42D4.19 [Caenorhabditis elegans]|eukprot:NP_001294320.1 Uncharacterized protein CELE_C42D4.19 [Caenorhabditis elegans]